jgi:type VI secretion system protein ImpB
MAKEARLEISYEIEEGGAKRKIELPFVLGVVADLSNKPVVDEDGDKIRVRDRKFVEIDKENFNKVMRSISPEARVEVEDRLTGGGNRVVAELKFQSMEDFRPENVARQVPALKELLEVREELARLRRKLDGKAKAENVLFRAIERTIAMMEGGSTGGKEDEE